jgi:2-keto-4-pentenoate hydratase/2-oxohepta-3-ene-1,7-dioic acid hydratase in catechol pathway
VRLVRFRFGERISTGVLEGGVIRVLQGTFFEAPVPTGEEIPADDVRLLAPVLPSKIVGVGLNYASHAKEFGSGDLPQEPLLFLKPSTSVIGSGDPIPLHPASEQVDFEGELAVVIGRLAHRVGTPEEAAHSILGYTCGNDVTLRDLQRRDDQWTRAKGFDGAAPLGPWIETQIQANDLQIESRVNGETRQSSRTSDMVFGPVALVSYTTQFMTLLPGDVILTGTPAGVGPLAHGDEVEIEIEGIGVLANRAVAG